MCFLLQFENLTSILRLPGKKTFNNMDRDFLEKRKKDLNAYLQVRVHARVHLGCLALCSVCVVCIYVARVVFQLLINPEMVKACPTLLPYVYDFLENKAYNKGKGDFARKVSEAEEC